VRLHRQHRFNVVLFDATPIVVWRFGRISNRELCAGLEPEFGGGERGGVPGRVAIGIAVVFLRVGDRRYVAQADAVEFFGCKIDGSRAYGCSMMY
jgi:hypothetical protein